MPRCSPFTAQHLEIERTEGKKTAVSFNQVRCKVNTLNGIRRDERKREGMREGDYQVKKREML